MKIDNELKNHFFFDIARQGKFFFAFIIVFFGFFGVIQEAYKRTIHEELIWLWQTFSLIFSVEGNPIPGFLDIESWTFYGFIPPLLLLFACLYLGYSEDVYLYGIKNSLWLAIFTNILSIFWYYFINFWRPPDITSWTAYIWDAPSPFYLLFGTWQGWVNIIIIMTICLFGAILGWQLKEFVRNYIKHDPPFIKEASELIKVNGDLDKMVG